jgi:predicted RNA-binding protein with PUA-like domain
LTDDDIVLTINDVVEDHDSSTANGSTDDPSWTYTPTTTVSSNGVTIKIELNEELTGVVTLTGLKVNTKSQSSNFSKRFEDVVVKLVKQEDVGSVTKFTVAIDGDDDLTVSDLLIGTGGKASAFTGLA